MAYLIPRNSPKSPFSVKPRPENPRPPYKRGEGSGEKIPGADLFGLVQQVPKRTNAAPEAAALCEVLKALDAHPGVAWAHRCNSGAARVGNRFIRFGWPGCPDVLGQLKDGRLLGVEVKAPKGRPSPEQSLFSAQINAAGGVGFVARDLRDVLRVLGPL